MNTHVTKVQLLLSIFCLMVLTYVLFTSCLSGQQPNQEERQDSVRVYSYGPMRIDNEVRFIGLTLEIAPNGNVEGAIKFSPNADNPYERDSAIAVKGSYFNNKLSLQVADMMVIKFDYYKYDVTDELFIGACKFLDGKKNVQIRLINNYDGGYDLYNGLSNVIATTDKESNNNVEKDSIEIEQKIIKIEETIVDSLKRAKQAENNNDQETIKRIKQAKQRADYVLDDAKLDGSNLEGLSKEELRLMRNEIYARNGYIFNSRDLKNYFGKKDWYIPYSGNNSKVSKLFSNIEKYNVNIIIKYEQSLNKKVEKIEN